jgi:NAD(P)-dependent dehydrogenase (short-subunit alcohol dehydrogenase family)
LVATECLDTLDRGDGVRMGSADRHEDASLVAVAEETLAQEFCLLGSLVMLTNWAGIQERSEGCHTLTLDLRWY